MSCSPGPVLNLWRAHSPPNPSLMRKLIQNMMGSYPKEDFKCLGWIQPARYPERNMVLPSPTLRCCTPPFAQWQMIAHTTPLIPRLYQEERICSVQRTSHIQVSLETGWRNPCQPITNLYSTILSGYWGEGQLLMDNALASTAHTGLHWHRQKVNT